MPNNDRHTVRAAPSGAGRFSVTGPELRRRFEAHDLFVDVTAGPTAPALHAIEIRHLTDDSRAVEPDGAFVAIQGTEADGHTFIESAVQAGAQLVVCETVPEAAAERFSDTVFVHVNDSRVALAEMAAALYDDPADALRMVGVTGTNGKTTVAFLLHHLLDALGETAGLISTIEVRTGADTDEAALTTPGPVELQRTLRRMVDHDCTACAMEVSSHALDQDRVHGIDYEVGIFTNLTVDHLDYHGTPLAYRLAKKKLFDELGPGATALYNMDDEAGPTMVVDTAATLVSFALDRDADIQPEIRESGLDGLRLSIAGRECPVRLAGRFNAYNVAAAYGTGRALGHDADAVIDALADAPPVPGRFEQLFFEDGPTVIVDYAHTPDALEHILQAVREMVPAGTTLWCVFGCGGDRDSSKRRTMGSIAEQQADRVIVTSDNPRTEEPEHILNDIRRGVSRPNDMHWIVDRETAIRTAAEGAGPDDVVVIAGKGHETHQVVGTENRPFDDRDIARKYFG
jgi:UDP-N-acetylmuramoyl-L-alanyl-D-glutamate--2,6-diaminopimelate ligase